jgi:hypothetical protein
MEVIAASRYIADTGNINVPATVDLDSWYFLNPRR